MPLPPAGTASCASAAGSGTPAQSPLAPGNERLTPTEVLEWLLWPISPSTFFSEYWEKKPLHVRRGRPYHYGGLFAKADLDRHLREEAADFKYGERINLARFDAEAGRKISLNKGDRGAPVAASDVDAAWAEGASIQAMHPQQYHEPVWRLLTSLERAFAALFGANAYLTPAGRQGLAPHFDDVEVVMLQLEGSKHWRLHAPPEDEEYPLPREYSRDFVPGELGELLLDCTLEPGDLLYLPRGTVHYGVTQGQGSKGAEGPGSFSHHLTVSTYQKTAWCDLLEKALLSALGRAASESIDFRAGLPVGFLGYMGSWHDCEAASSAEAADGRAAFQRRLKGLVGRLQDFIDADEVCDELGVDFMSQRLPPARPSSSNSQGSGSVGGRAEKENGAGTVALGDRVRWLDPSAVRAMISTDPDTSEATVMLFHSCANTRGQHMCKAVEAEEEVGCLRFEAATFLPAIHALYGAGNEFVRCSDLPLADEGDKAALCENLLEAGLLERAPPTG
mmetsp:Transcript_51592/g.160068  ORF Transcript_51592/g.160068 Transcript_51592/m.160068 type:complete len:506 (+) Transcript_51592:1734-3251(+)